MEISNVTKFSLYRLFSSQTAFLTCEQITTTLISNSSEDWIYLEIENFLLQWSFSTLLWSNMEYIMNWFLKSLQYSICPSRISVETRPALFWDEKKKTRPTLFWDKRKTRLCDKVFTVPLILIWNRFFDFSTANPTDLALKTGSVWK
jgi:hypothetical protein